MPVIRQFPEDSGCSVCNSLVDLPHENEEDCRRALAKEMDALVARAKAISKTTRSFTNKRLRQIDAERSKQENARKRAR